MPTLILERNDHNDRQKSRCKKDETINYTTGTTTLRTSIETKCGVRSSEEEEENDHHPNADVSIFQPSTTTTNLNKSITNHHDTRYNNHEHDPFMDKSGDPLMKRPLPPPTTTTNIPTHRLNTHPTTRTAGTTATSDTSPFRLIIIIIP